MDARETRTYCFSAVPIWGPGTGDHFGEIGSLIDGTSISRNSPKMDSATKVAVISSKT